jgi:cell division septation protein DedD
MNRKLALILSLVYCGFGQIYKGEAWKGINFAIIYTTLILSLIFIASTSPLAQLALIILLILMWLTGMIDAYADEKTFIEGNHGLLWKTLIMVLIVIGIFGSVVTVTLLVVRPQVFASDSGTIDTNPASNSNKTMDSSQPKTIVTKKLDSVLQEAQTQIPNTQTNETIQEKPAEDSNQAKTASSEEIKSDVESEKTGYYTVQVGAFSESNRAEELAKQLQQRGYSVNVILPLANESPAFYKVWVGKFDSKDSAANNAEKLNKYEGVTKVAILNIRSHK